jgi:Raf kinase inhibitor-like YbhB/YbcL family protein
VPLEAKSLAIIVDDPDAPMGTFTHYLAWNIVPGTHSIREGEANAVGVQGVTSFSTTGYGGPCPPPGKAHRYVFKLYALDAVLDVPPGASKMQFETEADKHLLGVVELVGRYER